MSSAEASSEISPRELERDQLKKRLEKLASSSFDSSSATPRPAEPTKISTQTFVDSHEQLLRNIEQYGDVLFDMLPDKEAFQNDPRYIIQDEEGEITHEGMLYLAEQIIAIIQEHGLINGIDQDHPGFASVAESFIPENDQRATLDAVTALQILGVGSVINRLTELYKPETHNYITTHATGLNRRSVRTGYAPRRDGITLSDRYTNVFEVNKTNTITIDGKQVTYDKVNATLLSKPAEFYDLFEKINSHVEVTDDMVKRLLTYVGSKINSPDFWNVRDDEDKAEMQLLLSQLEAATENKEKKRLFGTVINRLFKNNDISVELAAMTSGGDVLAAGMPVQNRMQEWGRIVFGNETRGADQETTAMSREATIDLRSAQALFNILIPPEQLKELYILDHEIAILRKPYDDEIAKANAISEAADRKKELEDIYKRMHRDQQLNEKIAAKTDMRTSFYDAILTAYNVEEPDGSKTGTTVDNPFIDAIRERKKLLKGNTWNDINDKSKTELMASLDDHNDPDGDIRRAIMRGHYNTTNSLDRLTKRFGSDFIRNNRAGNDIVVSMGLKGIELLKRRAKTERKIIPETIEHDLKAIMERTVPAEVTVYGRVEEGAQPEQPDEQLTQLLEKLKGSTEQEDDTPSDLPVEDEQPVTNTAQLGEGDKLKNKASVSDAAETPQPSSNEVVEMAILYEKQYHKLPQSESIEATAAIEAAVGLLSEGNRDESIDWFRRALEHDPSSLQAMYGIAVTSPDVAEQTAMLEHILRQQPDFKVARLLLSNLQNEPSEQQPTGETDLTALHIEIAQLMQEMRITDARAKARELTEKHPTDPEGWYLRAVLHPNNGTEDRKRKRRWLREALKHDPNHNQAKQLLAALEETAPLTSAEVKSGNPLLQRIERIELNKLAQDVHEDVKLSTNLDTWLSGYMTDRTIATLITTTDPADAALAKIKRHLEAQTEGYARHMEEQFEWPANKHKENLRIIQDIMLYEIKQRVDQYRQTHQEKPARPENSSSALPERLNEAILKGETLFVITHEIQQAFIDNNETAINGYLTEARTILTVDATTLPDYDDRHFDQIRAEGIKTMYLQILDSAIQNRAHKQLLIDRLEQHGIPDLFASVLQEDMRRLSPTQVTEADFNNHSARLFGVAAKMEVMELLLKITTPKYLPVTHHLFAEGSSLRTALEHVTTVSPSSSPDTVVGELEAQLQDVSKKIQSFITQHESKVKSQTDTPPAEKQEQKQEATVAQVEEAIMTGGLLTDDDIQTLQSSDDYQRDLTVFVNVIYELLEGKQHLDVIKNNILFSKKTIREAIEQIVSKTPTRIR